MPVGEEADGGGVAGGVAGFTSKGGEELWGGGEAGGKEGEEGRSLAGILFGEQRAEETVNYYNDNSNCETIISRYVSRE